MTQNNIDSLIPSYLANSRIYSVAVTDLDGNFSYINPVFEKAFDFLKINLIGEHFQLTVHPEYIDKYVVAVQDCLDHPDKVYQLQIRNPAHISEDFYLTSWEFSLLLGAEQQPLGILCIGSDVTEVARVNLQVREFSQKLDILVEEITDGFYMLNQQWEFVKINSVAEKTIGISRAELFGQKIWDVLPNNSSKENYVTHFKQAMQDRITLSFEDYQANLHLWFNVICYPSHEGLTVFFKNITDEKKTCEELQDSRFKLKAILDSSTDSNILISPDYKILCCNKRASETCEAVFGQPMLEFQDMWNYVLPDNKEDFYTDTQRAFNGEYLKFEKELVIEGKTVWYGVSYFPVYDNDETILGVTFNICNIDFRKKAELKIHQSEVMLRSLYNSSSEALTFIDKNFKIVFSNNQAKSITDSIHGKVSKIGDLVLDFFGDELKDEFLHYYQRALNGEKISVEKEHLCIWWHFSIFPVYDMDNHFVGISQNVTDVTLQKNSDLKIHNQNEKLKTIAWQQCHEVRGPLSNILGLCDLVTSNPNLDRENTNQYLKYIKESSQELDEIIQAIITKTTEE